MTSSAAQWLIDERVVARARRLVAEDPALATTMSTADDVAAIRGGGGACIEYFARACARYGARTCFVRDGAALSYADVWQRVQALAAGAREHGLLRPRTFVGICGPPAPDWVIADLACLYAGAISVPLHVGMPRDQLLHAVRLAELDAILCSPSELAELDTLRAECPSLRAVVDYTALAARPGPFPAWLPGPGDDALVTVSFSSGSTGMPKGVMLTERRWSSQLRFALEWPRVPHVHVGYLPHSHITGRRLAHEVMMNGGVTHFPAGDAANVFEFVRRARPTILPLLPHLANLTHQHFLAEVARRGDAEAVMREMRATFFGDRLCLIRTGTAPLAPEVLELVARCFDVPVANGYGSTELGSIAINGRVLPQHELKLVDAPELGYVTGSVPPRGELRIRSPEATIGYLRDAAATAELFDRDGFLRTGDVAEVPVPGMLVPLGRRNDVLRLAHGEFVQVGELEVLYSGRIPAIRQLFIHGEPSRASLVAVVVPHDTTGDPARLRRELRREIRRVAREAGRAPHEVPRDLLVEPEPFTRENQLLTDSMKLNRPRATARYKDALGALYAELEARASEHSARAGSIRGCVRAAAIATLGVDGEDLDEAWAEHGFAGLGGDSLTAARFCQLVGDLVGVAPQIGVVLDPTGSFEAIALHVEELRAGGPDQVSFETVHGEARDRVRAADLDYLVESAGPARAFSHAPPRVVVLTGATGFLGKFLALELLARLPAGGRLVCLVRGEDDGAARDRLRASYRAPARLDDPRLEVRAGDLLEPALGLPAAIYEQLAREATAIVHAGALVNHALDYRSLFGPNVAGTARLARLALDGGMALHFVSSIGVLGGGTAAAPVREEKRAAELWQERPVGGPDDTAIGYLTSKWAGEVLLDRLHARWGLPVTISRCGVLLPHREAPAEINEDDAIHRLLVGIAATGLAPRSFYAASEPPPYFGGLPVDLAAAAIAAIALAPTSGLATYHVDEATRTGVSLDTFVEAMAREGIPLQRLPYRDWYARFGEALAALPEAVRSRSPLAILRRWAKPADPAKRRWFDNASFRAHLGASTLQVAPLSADFISAWVREIGRSVTPS